MTFGIVYAQSLPLGSQLYEVEAKEGIWHLSSNLQVFFPQFAQYLSLHQLSADTPKDSREGSLVTLAPNISSS